MKSYRKIEEEEKKETFYILKSYFLYGANYTVVKLKD